MQTNTCANFNEVATVSLAWTKIHRIGQLSGERESRDLPSFEVLNAINSPVMLSTLRIIPFNTNI